MLLRCRIERDREHNILTINQNQYISEIIDEYGMKDCISVGTPMAAKSNNDMKIETILDKKRFPFPHLIEKVLYCLDCIRPNINVAV